jgi:hypothetical protein
VTDFLKELIPSGAWKYPILALIILVYALPHVRKLWFEVRQQHSELDFMKRRLEVAKLQFELKTLAASHPELGAPPSELFDTVPVRRTKASTEITVQPLNPVTQYVWGFVGGILPIALTTVRQHALVTSTRPDLADLLYRCSRTLRPCCGASIKRDVHPSSALPRPQCADSARVCAGQPLTIITRYDAASSQFGSFAIGGNFQV